RPPLPPPESPPTKSPHQSRSARIPSPLATAAYGHRSSFGKIRSGNRWGVVPAGETLRAIWHCNTGRLCGGYNSTAVDAGMYVQRRYEGSEIWRQRNLAAAKSGGSEIWRQRNLAAAKSGGSEIWRQRNLGGGIGTAIFPDGKMAAGFSTLCPGAYPIFT